MGDVDYAARIEAARNNSDELSRIADELQKIPGSRLLLMRAINLRRQLRTNRGDAVAATASYTEPPKPATWLSDLGLPAVDGRPLYKYRLSDSAFELLQHELRSKSAALAFDPGHILSAKFVLWAAEWFRRHYDGTGRAWDAVGQPIGLKAAQCGRRLTDTGLRHWRIPELRLNGTHHRLAAIARQGGFPVAALDGPSGGWAARFLERLVGLLLAVPDPTVEVADAIAEKHMDMVPETWRSDEIRVVSAELACEIVRLKRLAEQAGVPSGSLVSMWLDEHYGGWRDDLPVSVGSDAGRVLVDGLIRTDAIKGGAGSVHARRLLTIDAEGRRERVELHLTGSIQDVAGKVIPRTLMAEWNRLRLFPSGDFAHFVVGELAVVDPDDDNKWMARQTAVRNVVDLPAETPVLVELRGGGQRVGKAFILPGGDSVNANVRVYDAPDCQDADVPTEFALIGSGSRGYAPKRVYVDLPNNWACRPDGLASHCNKMEEPGASKRSIWMVEGAAIVTSSRGDLYLVRSGQKTEMRDVLLLTGEAAPGCSISNPAVSLFAGRPALKLTKGQREWNPSLNEVWWRRRGEARWRSDLDAAGPGAVEYAWRDVNTGHIRDRRDAVVLPEGFRIERRRRGEWLELSIHGWPGRIELDAGERVDTALWRFVAKETNRASCQATLIDATGATLQLTVPLPHQACIADWSSGPVAVKQFVSLSSINRFAAVADGRCELFGVLLDREGRTVSQGLASWWVEGELPLSTIRDDLAALLHSLGDTRTTVKLSFNDSSNNFWMVREFESRLELKGTDWIPDRKLRDGDVRIVGRSPLDPATEKDFGRYDRSAGEGPQPLDLPSLEGDWLIYLRSSERVLSAPSLVKGDKLGPEPRSSLARAMAVSDRSERLAELTAVCDDVLATPSAESSRSFVRSVIDLALSLDGLPASTFDILTLLEERPLLAVTMLFQAAPAEVEPLLRLSDGLPFTWASIPKHVWTAAGQSQFDYLQGLVPDAIPLVAQVVGERSKAIAVEFSALAPLLNLSSPHKSLSQAANDFITRSDDRIQLTPSPFRPSHTQALPSWPMGKHFWRALDAPVAAALAAQGRISLNRAQVICIKNIGRRHPQWFREGFVAALSGEKQT